MRARVYITLKPGVHDPAGRAVMGALAHLGHDDVLDVRVGKFIEVEIADAPPESARARVEEMCRKLLANPVIETYRVEVG
jgi:phosphoribosylformylglycinamidine synthase